MEHREKSLSFETREEMLIVNIRFTVTLLPHFKNSYKQNIILRSVIKISVWLNAATDVFLYQFT